MGEKGGEKGRLRGVGEQLSTVERGVVVRRGSRHGCNEREEMRDHLWFSCVCVADK